MYFQQAKINDRNERRIANGVNATPKRRWAFLLVIFVCLCITKPLLKMYFRRARNVSRTVSFLKLYIQMLQCCGIYIGMPRTAREFGENSNSVADS